MRLDDSFAYLVLSIVEEIPEGKVCTYGQLAELAGYPGHARQVAKVLSNASFYGDYPCHRVVNAVGRLAPGWDEQRFLLADEGVTFKASGCVNLSDHLFE